MDGFPRTVQGGLNMEMSIKEKVSESGDDWYTAECLNEAVDILKGGGAE